MLDTARIRAITLDLDDTLWPVWPTIRRADQAMRDWLGAHGAARTAALATEPEATAQARRAVLTAQPEIAHNLGAIRFEALRHLLGQAGDDPALAEPAYAAFYAARQCVTLFDDARPALEFLAARYPVVVLSNGNADVQRIGLGAYFRAQVSAGEVGFAKPDRRIFHAGAEAASVQPHEVLHIGDDAHLDAAGALASGMQAAWVNREGHLWPSEYAEPPHATVPDLRALCALLN